MTDQTVRIHLGLDDTSPEADAEESERAARQLRDGLLELDVQTVEFAPGGETPEGTKAGVPPDLSTILLTLAASGGVLTTIIGVLQSWLTRHERRSVTLEIDGDKIEITGISSEEQKRLIDAWMRRHRGFVIADE
jgi:hypothetical protein